MKLRELLPKRRWITGLGLLVAFGISSYVGLMGFLDWRARREWAEACAEADRLDPGWRWEELVAGTPRASGRRTAPDHVAAAVRLYSLAQNSNAINGETGMLILSRHPQYRLPHRLPPQFVTAIEARLAQTAPVMAELDGVRDGKDGWIVFPSSPVLLGAMPKAGESLDLLKRLIFSRLAVRADKWDLDGALDDAQLMLHISDPSRDAPSLLHNLYSAAERIVAADAIEWVLAQGEPSPAALDGIRRLVEMEVARPSLLPAFRGERAMIEDTLRALDDGRLTRDDVATSRIFADPINLTGWKKADEWLTKLTGGDLRRAKGVALFKHDTQVIEWLKESPDGLKIHEAEWVALRSRMKGAAQIQAGYLARYAADAATADAKLRCAAVALAAEQFRRETGRWPDMLTELVPNYLSAVPRDPCDLQPLRLARRPDGIVIYSVGEDGTDEGGAIASDGAAKAIDIGIRLWDVDKRRQPPHP
jgi:hypothetical protein